MSTNEPAIVSENTLAPPPRENLFRALAEAPELERAEGDTMPTMVVDWVRFGEWTEINSAYEGRFMERIAPGSVDKTVAESRSQMRVLFDHGKDPSIGNKVLGAIADIEVTDAGARGIVPLFDTQYVRELLPGLEAGQYGSSFRFQVMQEDFNSKPKRSDHNPRGIPERTVTEMRVREWGPVTFPAYAGATAGLRSITDEILLDDMLADPERLKVLIGTLKVRDTLSVAIPRDLEPEPSEAATPPEPGIEPEPSEATTRQTQTPATPVRLYPYREEKPRWLL